MGQFPPSSAYNEAGDGAFILPELMTDEDVTMGTVPFSLDIQAPCPLSSLHPKVIFSASV
jgi:hypothetical protein